MENEKRKRNPKERLLDWLAWGILGTVFCAIVAFVGWLINLVLVDMIQKYQTDPIWRQGADNGAILLLIAIKFLIAWHAVEWAVKRLFSLPADQQPVEPEQTTNEA